VRAPALLVALVISGCSGASLPPSSPSGPADPPPPPRLPGPVQAAPLPPPADEPKPLPGLESVHLDGRARELFWKALSELYAPCPNQAVSLRQCIEETRPCAACTPAALLLGEKISEGATANDAREMYAARFGPDLKSVDVADSPSRGPADAPVTIIVWSDFGCPHCKHAMPILDRVLERHAAQVRLVHKFYPLSQHAHSGPAARAAIAAQAQGRYWEMERLLFENQDAQEDSNIDRYARELKLDMKRFHADMSSARATKILERDHADGERAGLSGTPHILINGRPFDSAHFNLNLDLDAWVTLELTLHGAAPPAK
jgi:predicted DsbA family dithiol-disulfide isomerase